MISGEKLGVDRGAGSLGYGFGSAMLCLMKDV